MQIRIKQNTAEIEVHLHSRFALAPHLHIAGEFQMREGTSGPWTDLGVFEISQEYKPSLSEMNHDFKEALYNLFVKDGGYLAEHLGTMVDFVESTTWDTADLPPFPPEV